MKDAATEVKHWTLKTEIKHFKNLMHSVYHHFKNRAVRQNLFEKQQDQSLNIG